jgi:PAS domain S-box-containing protein
MSSSEDAQVRSVATQDAQSIQQTRARVEEQLRQQSELLRVTLASVDDGVICTDASGRVVLLNHNSEALTGWKSQDAEGRHLEEVFRIVNELTRATVENAVSRPLREGKPATLANHTVLISKQGVEHPIEHTAAPIRDESGAVTGCVVVFRNVTERRKSERALSISKERTDWQRRVYEAILANTPDLAYVWDLEHRFIYANEGLLKMWGRTWEEAIGKGCLELGYEPWHAAMHDREIDQVILTKKPLRGQVPFTGTFGRRIYDYILVPVLDADGEVEAVAGTTRDITDHKLAEERIRTSEERVRLATDAAELGIWVWDTTSDEVLWENDRAYTIFGLPLGSAPVNAARFKTDFVIPDDAAEFQRSVDKALLTQERFEFLGRIKRVDGAIRWVEFIGRPVPGVNGEKLRMHGTAEDVTERVLAAERTRAAAESNAKMRSLFEQGTQFAGMLSLDGRVIEANKACLELCGFTREDVIGKLFWECGWWNRSPELMNTVREAALSAAEGRPFRAESKYFVADGRERYVDLSIAPVRDENGTILFVSPTGTDITDRKAAEEQLALHKEELEARVQERTKELMETHHRLRTSERMASMGAMSAGLGHDMGNLLMPLRVRLDSLEESVTTEQSKEDIKAIRTAAEYLQRLANGLRLLALDPEHSRRGEVTELCSWWADAHGVMQSVLPRGITIEADLPSGECRTGISKAALTQVVFNLVQNAGDAMAEEAGLRVGGTDRRLVLGTIRVRGWCEGDWVLVSVSDEGPGMTETVKARCMEPFFTTKTRGISTGLGLVLVYGLVREAGGSVEVESELGKGTTFTLRLPLAKEKDRSASHSAQVAILQLKDARLHSFVAGELRSLGFEVRSPDVADASAVIAVVDDASRVNALPASTRIVFMGSGTGQLSKSVIALGEKPAIASIREALRALSSSDDSRGPIGGSTESPDAS